MKYKLFYDQQFSLLLESSNCSRNNYFTLDKFSHFFVNQLIRNGKRQFAISVFLECFSSLKRWTLISPIYFLRYALFNTRSFFNVQTIVRGRRSFYKGSYNHPISQIRKSIRLVITLANQFKSDYPHLSFSVRLALSILNCFFKKGTMFRQLRRVHFELHNNKVRFPQLDISDVLNVRFKRTKKTKGFYFLKKYGLYKRLTPIY
jgi:ribosomal protein S7